jgi:ubiquinone/menaquinone biosynthesis C-methylase UbiE
LKREFTNVIRHIMDEWIPPVIRDSRWFMYPFFYFAYRGKNIAEVMDFKRKVYSFTPEEYDRFYNGLDTISRNRETDLNKACLDFILDRIDSGAQSLIDVGCGNGLLLREIHQRHPHLKLAGIDIKEKVQDAAQRCFEFVRGDIEKLPFADKSFDVVTCSHVIEHLLHPEKCLAEFLRVAKKQLFIVTPKQRFFYYTLDEHVNFFPYQEKLTSLIPLTEYHCENLDGDWAYEGKVPQASGAVE